MDEINSNIIKNLSIFLAELETAKKELQKEVHDLKYKNIILEYEVDDLKRFKELYFNSLL